MIREVTVHPIWLQEENLLMKRLQEIISGDKYTEPYRKENGSWQLDSSNDWWARIEEGKLILSARYSQKKLDALATFVEEFMGPL